MTSYASDRRRTTIWRWFRFYEKKRGNRRTVPKKFGSVGEALFFGFFLVVGCVAFWAMLSQLIVPEWRANRHFVETKCTVLDKRIAQTREGQSVQYRPDIDIEYRADGELYQAATYDITRRASPNRELAENALNRFEVGKEYPCWYDPMDPGTAVLIRGYSGWLYLILLVPISFMAIGAGRLIYTWANWGTSAERRSVMNQRAAEFDPFEAATDRAVLPNVPGDANLTNSPGTRLAYRLPISAAPGWTLFAILLTCLLWNGIVAIFVVMAVQKHLSGQPDWLLTLFVAPFGLIGLTLVGYLGLQFWITTRIGATRLEISHHPLYPGEECQVSILQEGRLTMSSLKVFLVCDEQATYRQGTDTRTETRTVYKQCEFAVQNIEIEDPRPFESQCTIHVPARAMHSFRSEHNEIGWKLLMRGEIAGRPEYQRSFQVVVCPPLPEAKLG